ncbi:hypothetical protein [Bradyrhizobium sp. CB2312]|uniref:hypothetical protein n=1 Tax=Bradyrhizobium sp. CB2312 TaxID=3039155 RepID=UPI0024B1932C|nr:hypothetical protein [Bradyrhizobium sp. CB2312]WFU76575.1 hypothetical protein QA642_22495 [Bradyrhizobium sp. CB2312]
MSSSVSFTYDDGRRKGSYETKSGMIHVTTEFGTKATQVGGSPPLVIARMLARELMQAAKLK